MIFTLKNKFINIDNYNLKCAIGKRGRRKNKREGDKFTPTGTYRFIGVYYRKDRINNLKTNLKKIIIKKSMGWCDDIRSKDYNKRIKFPFNYRAEKLYRSDNIYDIIIEIDYNKFPIIKKKGSAIFIHIAKKKYSPTKGCIAMSKKDIKFFLKKISKKDRIRII
tara:strand:- start:1340 stop:1831 length:492 start_codon:yes stop_codon:yes gene_type:complete